MLEVQKFLLNGGTLQDLENNLGIFATYHPDSNIPLVILNYDQIESKPANHEIVVECRNLVLELNSWHIVSQSFKRFFNYGQYPDAHEKFNWESSFCQEKVDGSLMSLFFYRDSWYVTTRGSWAHLPCGESGRSWSELFFSILPKETIEKVCLKGTSYIFEFCSPWNKVVAEHQDGILFLLTAILSEIELDKVQVDWLANQLGIGRPLTYNFKSMEEILAYIETQISTNPTWEGVVICDGVARWKIKNPGYLALHRLANNGQGFSVKNLIPFILKGDEEEALIYIRRYFKEVIPMFEELKIQLDSELARVVELWHEVKDISSQKEFAQAVIQKTKFSSLFFKSRQQGKYIGDLWRESEDLILKILFNKQGDYSRGL